MRVLLPDYSRQHCALEPKRQMELDPRHLPLSASAHPRLLLEQTLWLENEKSSADVHIRCSRQAFRNRQPVTFQIHVIRKAAR